MEKLQVCGYMTIMSVNSAFCGLKLAAVHAQEKWPQPFPVHPGIERKRVRLSHSEI